MGSTRAARPAPMAGLLRDDAEIAGPVLTRRVHLVGLVIGVVTALLHVPRRSGDDWASLWIAGIIARDDEHAHLYDHHPEDFATWFGPVWDHHVHTGDYSPYPHPFVQAPVVAEALAPLTRIMSFDVSLVLLTVASGWSLAVLVAAAWHLWAHATVPTGVLVVVAAGAWLSVPFQDAVQLGQTTMPVIAAVAYAVAAARTSPTVTGLVLAAAAVVKLTPLLLIVLLLLFRRTRPAGWRAIGAGAIFSAVSLLAAGWQTHVDWVTRLREIAGGAIVAPASESIPSIALLSRWHESQEEEDSVVVLTVADPPGWVGLLTAAVAVTLVGLVVTAAWHRREYSYELLTVGLFTAVTLTTGLVWTHYLIIALLPAAGALLAGHARSLTAAATALALLPQFAPIAGENSLLPFPGGGLYSALAVTVIMCVSVGWSRRRTRSDTT